MMMLYVFNRIQDHVIKGFTSNTFKEGNYCIPNNLDETIIGEPYCANLYNGHHLGCSQRAPTDQTAPLTESDCGSECELYQDERIKLLPSSTLEKDRGICVSDGQHNYNQETGAEMGLLMTDVECGQHKTNEECINFNGLGCKWEPFNSFVLPKIDMTEVKYVCNRCKPIQGHVPGDYDVNMLDAENIKMADYNDRNNKKYPYFTSKYLCDVCHMRDKDLDNMYDMRGLPDQLKYYMIKKRITFSGSNPAADVLLKVTPQQYCEQEVNDNNSQNTEFKPCEWDTTDTSGKGGKCVSKCSKTHNKCYYNYK